MLVQIFPTKLRKLMEIVLYVYQSSCDPMFLSPTNETEIIKIVKSISQNKSPGHDEVPPSVLKSIIVIIATPRVHVFNLSFYHGQFPTRLKLAKVS